MRYIYTNGWVININTAKSLKALLQRVVVSFFSLLQGKVEPPHCTWNFYKYRVVSQCCNWNNSISTKFKKVERTITHDSYLSLLGM